MAIVSVIPIDAGRETVHWEIPTENALNLSPIPRGVRKYGGTAAIAALGAGDETNVGITLTFPSAFIYLPKNISLTFRSDDLTTEFSNIGTLEYRPAAVSALGTRIDYELFCDGPSFWAASNSEQYYRPKGSWRQWVNGPDGDTVLLFIADISGDTSTAGDVAWTADFWEYDVNQCLKWPVNTPTPIINY